MRHVRQLPMFYDEIPKYDDPKTLQGENLLNNETVPIG